MFEDSSGPSRSIWRPCGPAVGNVPIVGTALLDAEMLQSVQTTPLTQQNILLGSVRYSPVNRERREVAAVRRVPQHAHHVAAHGADLRHIKGQSLQHQQLR